jgi:cell division protein FtsL
MEHWARKANQEQDDQVIERPCKEKEWKVLHRAKAAWNRNDIDLRLL